MKSVLFGAALALLALPALAQQTVTKAGTPAPNAGGVQGVINGVPIPITGTINASSSCHATAAAPTYSEGSDDPLSCDLSGTLRTAAGGGGGGLTDTQLRATPVPVSGSGTFDISDRVGRALGIITIGAGSATIGKVDQGAAGASAWLVTGTGGTFPVTGTFWPTAAASPLSASISVSGAFIDPRSIRALTSADVVTFNNSSIAVTQGTPANLQATVTGAVVGHGTAATAMRVELPTDGTGTVGLIAGSAVVGKMGIDQTTPGTTNAVQDASTSATGSAVPSKAAFMGGGAAGGAGNLVGSTVKAASTAPAATDTAVVVTTRDTVTVSGTVTTTPPSNASTNIAQVAGTTTDTNSGTKSAGTIRVVIATDQPALTNKLLVTPDSVALPANQSVNMAQVGGTNTVTGGLAGSQGVGGLAANGSAVSGNPVYTAGLGFNGTANPPRYCDKIATISTLGTTATVQQIALVASQKIYICGYLIKASTATAAINLKWVEGTGTNCASAPTADVTPTIFTTPTSAPATANWTLGPFGSPGIPWMTNAGNALCINQSATTNSTTLSGVIFYTQN